MKPKDHANLIGIFAWIMSGWQLLLSLFFGGYALMLASFAVGIGLDPNMNDPGGPVMIFGIMAALFGLFALLGLTGSISNFILGRRLRADEPPTKKFVITACVINFASFFTGGIFAAALAGYALWFATSDLGKAFFAGSEELPYAGALPGEGFSAYDPNYARDPSRINWR